MGLIQDGIDTGDPGKIFSKFFLQSSEFFAISWGDRGGWNGIDPG